MPHYKLVPSGKPEIQADEIILSRDESGEVEHSLSLRRAREIPEELLNDAHALAGRLGFKIVEAAPPEDDEERPVGADTASGSPVIKQTGESTSEIDQQAQAGRAAQQDTAGAGGGGSASTAGSGTPSTSGTTNAPSGATTSNT